MDLPEIGCVDRRCLLAAAAAGSTALLAGCTTYGQQASSAAPTTPGSAGHGSPAAGGATNALVAAADVPVGGGKVVDAAKVVVTQPTAGTFKAFSSICTHQGCSVIGVGSGTINCPCHGSRFSPVDGSVKQGPAKKPLAEVPVTVKDGQVVKA
jgi:Rieske Fe-S protein